MRIVLFYSGIESFNYFTDRIVEELEGRGHDCFVLDLRNPAVDEGHSYAAFMKYMTAKVDMAIGFDGYGLKEDLFIALWNSMNTKAVNILMDHPLRFHPTMRKHPKNYVQLCCDRNHVEYVKKFFTDEVENVDFMPHAGTLMGEPNLDDYSNRPYDIVFSGTYYTPDSYIEKIKQDFPDNEFMQQFYIDLSQYMIAHTDVTTEQAVLDLIVQKRMNLALEQVLTMIRCSEPIDWMARMHFRGEAIKAIADAGLQIWLLGRGWENHPSAGLDNVHIVSDRVPFADTLPIMAKAKINLNVMPWFKDGTHDRIFNILLQGSLPVTDASGWLLEHFEDNKDIVFFDINNLSGMVEKIRYFLGHPTDAIQIIQNGFWNVSTNYVWKNCVNQILGYTES